MANTIRKNLGMVTAYAYAVSKGYTGTEEEFAELMASYADVAQDAEASAQAAAGSSNSASLYAQNASASATNAAGSASSASTYAGNASTSAQDAEGSANAAQASATQAAGSADDAEAAKDTILGMNAVAETLPAGSQATASYSNGTLTLGIPKGDTGEKGDPGDSNDAPLIYSSASGSVANFTDGADDLPMKSAVVSIEPIQDLHGYDYPWPAGGGKNLFLPMASGGQPANVSFVRNNDGSVTFTGQANGTTRTPTIGDLTLPAGSYILNGVSGGAETSYGLRVSSYNGSSYDVIDTIYSGESQFTLTEETQIRVIGRFSSLKTDAYNVTMYPMIRRATEADGSFAPYENICPISGRTGLSVVRSGKNLINPALSPNSNRQVSSVTYENGDNEVTLTTVANANYMCLGLFYYFKSGTYTIKYSATSNDEYVPSLTIYKSNIIVKTGIAPDSSSTFTISADGIYEFRLFASTSGNGVVGRVVRFYDMQFESGSVSTPWTPYKANTYTVNWETEAGTVYGGSLNVMSGKLTVDRAYIASYNGEALPSTWISNRDVYAAGTTPTTGAQVVYKLAELVEYQLTPHEVRTLLGVNNIWSDSGDMAAEYPADTKLYIDQKITEAIAAAMV